MQKKIKKYHKHLIILPFVIAFFTLHTLPFLQGFFYSFTDWKGYGTWKFVGLSNFVHIFKDNSIISSYRFTFKLAIFSTIIVNIISLLIAIGLNANIKFKKSLKTIYFIPYILGTLIIGYIFNFIFTHLIPQIATTVNIPFLQKNILGTNHAWIGILIVTVWQSMAFHTLIYLSGLQTINKSIYEAARIDGASKMTQFRKITFPLLAPFFTINMILSARSFMMAFDQIVALTGGGPGTETTTISLHIYKKGFQGAQFSYQSANSVLLFIVILIFSFAQLKYLEKREDGIDG